jgi:putative hydrolase of the HAD superfamily
MKKTCILWDFDNTLAYRDGMWSRSFIEVLNQNGYTDYAYDDVRKYFGTGFPWHRHTEGHDEYFNGQNWWDYVNSLISDAFFDVGVTDKNIIKKLTLEFKVEYLRPDAWYLYDDTIKTLQHSIDKGYSNIILSNHVPELEELVKGLGIEKFFIAVINSAVVGYEKPNPKIFEEVLKLERNEKYYMIGDNYTADIKGSLDFGFDAILVHKDNVNNYEKYSINLDGIWQYINKE